MGLVLVVQLVWKFPISKKRSFLNLIPFSCTINASNQITIVAIQENMDGITQYFKQQNVKGIEIINLLLLLFKTINSLLCVMQWDDSIVYILFLTNFTDFGIICCFIVHLR